jgi:phosphate starvation-inducible PhoH-like protein
VQEEIQKRPVKRRTSEVKPLNDAQARYMNAIGAHKIVFGVGPAGTGKTWLAAMLAAHALENRQIEKIVVTRPAVEAGESLGFMPGEMEEKYEPYFRPVKDALEEFFGSGSLEYFIKTGVIEARPMAFLRGSTIKNAWLIADEMQNATPTQMKMLLTRLGENSRFIINGDPTQCDLPKGTKCGLTDAMGRLTKIGGIYTVRFGVEDIVRSGIVQEIVRAYETGDREPDAECYTSDEANAGLRRILKVEDERE